MKQRDAAQVLLFLFLFVLTMITLSQILMVHHSGRYGKNIKTTSSRSMQLSKKELLALDRSIEALRRSEVPSIDVFRKLLQNDIYADRIASIIKAASENISNSSYHGDLENGRDGLLSGGSALSFNPQLQSRRTSNLRKNMRLSRPSNGIKHMRRQSDTKIANSSRTNLTTTNSVSGGQVNRLLFLVQNSDSGNLRHRLNGNDSEEFTGLGEYINLDMCLPVPVNLLGRVFVDFNHTHNMTRQDVLAQHRDLQMGGIWRPPNCVARHRVAIIIPYRDREQHLVTLLSHLLPILKRQELSFQIFVTEQTGNDTFNKARIMNAAFKEAIKMYDFQCFVFHDVDLIPEDDRNMYSCPVQPRHMSVAIDEMDYRVPYDYLVGGVLSMRTEHFQMVNGYSNLYWGWGAEDDDMAFRIMHVGLKITRPPSIVARYKMIKHEKRIPTDWKKRSRLLRTGVRRFNFDGLNSVNYNLVSITKRNLFSHILVDIGKPPSLT